MRSIVVVLVVGCSSRAADPPPPDPSPVPVAKKPPDNMDEKMRHCPLALDGAVTTMSTIATGMRFEVAAPAVAVDEVRRRARHVIEFAARRHEPGTHGAFDGKGGGRMKNCPVVTDGVTISVEDLPAGARIDVTTSADRVAALQSESKSRATKFPFAGATIVTR